MKEILRLNSQKYSILDTRYIFYFFFLSLFSLSDNRERAVSCELSSCFFVCLFHLYYFSVLHFVYSHSAQCTIENMLAAKTDTICVYILISIFFLLNYFKQKSNNRGERRKEEKIHGDFPFCVVCIVEENSICNIIKCICIYRVQQRAFVVPTINCKMYTLYTCILHMCRDGDGRTRKSITIIIAIQILLFSHREKVQEKDTVTRRDR